MFPMTVQADMPTSGDSKASKEEEEQDKMASDVKPEDDEPAGSGRFQEEEADADRETPADATEGESSSPRKFRPMLTCRLLAVLEPLLLLQLLLLRVCTFFMELSLGGLEQALR